MVQYIHYLIIFIDYNEVSHAAAKIMNTKCIIVYDFLWVDNVFIFLFYSLYIFTFTLHWYSIEANRIGLSQY